MSRESMEWFANPANARIGYVDKRGPAWWGHKDMDNHYSGPVPMEDALSMLSWEARESAIEYEATLDDGRTIRRVDSREKMYYRSDTGARLGINGMGHQPHQYREWLIDNVEQIVGNGLAIGQVVLLKGGAVASVSVEMEDTLNYSGVAFRPQLTSVTSFDASLATTSSLMTTIVVCDNTLAVGLSEKSPKYKKYHTKNAKFDADEARDALGLVEAYGESFGRRLDELVNSKVSEDQFSNFIQMYVPMPDDGDSKRSKTLADNKRNALHDLWENDDRVSPWRGTQFGVLQATNTYLHWVNTVRGMDRVERNLIKSVTSTEAQSFASEDRRTLDMLALVLSS